MKKYSLLPIFLFLVSCKKEKTNYKVPCNSPTTEKVVSISLFKGSWSWVSELYQSRISGLYNLKTPATEGYTRQLIFKNSTELEFLKNDVSVSKYFYDIKKEKEITLFPSDTTNVLVFNEYPSGTYIDYVHFVVCNDTLILNFQITTDTGGKEKWAKNK